MRLFEVIPDKFFSILASPQKEIYADVIFILYKIVSYHTSFGIDREIMTELFERIVIDDEQSQGALEKYTDYRTYMDYDIKIIHDDGNTSSFSKVCREKSGGETQTPYYVAIVASFVHLYSSTQMNDSLGIILLDEALEKMDDNRIESMMQFLNKLNLQIIFTAPPQKIESISPFMKSTLVAIKEENFTWVEAFHREKYSQLF